MRYTQKRIVINTGAPTYAVRISINDDVNIGIIVPRDDARRGKELKENKRDSLRHGARII